jgi:lipopolysaccharide export system protein LptA
MKTTGMLAVALILGMAVVGTASSFAIGKTTLSGTVLDWNGQTITAKGNASFTTAPSKTPLKVGTMRLESIRANTIVLTLTSGKSQSLKEASATGGVIIRAKRADQETTSSGTTTVLRDVYATADSAVMPQTQDTVKLTGNVTVKVTEPGVAEPIAMLSGNIVTVSLKDNKIRVEGQADRPAEFTVTPKEGQK